MENSVYRPSTSERVNRRWLSLAALLAAALSLLVISFALAPRVAAAQSCPEGQEWSARPYQVTGPDGRPQMQQNFGCYPVNGQSSRKWEDRWGAIATDAVNAKLGAVTNMPNKRSAEQAAMSKCRSEGGTSCVLELVYYNQCAALVTGDKLYNLSTAATSEEATERGMKKCAQDEANCRLYYSACSLPVRVK